ncbi:4-hydroxy-tetrahydrodipicolinate synthase [Dokdonella soli]|uniref:4-hydroxy-tetrahydrodipicolinate synthase n=1 Tax=Dokdonella soli TaxID=529810 RepID=A0ABP3TI19_9GAMM
MILSGSICALATPLRARDDVLDLDAFGRLIDYQLSGGTRALVAAGSTGEAAALDDAEYSALIEFAVARVAARVPVLAGTGLSATRKTIVQTQRARAAGADAALVVAPAYVRPTQEGLYRHFSEVADRGGLPVVLYNVPSRTSCDLLPETVARLVGHGNIVGIKEALPDPARMSALLEFSSASFRVLSGDDPSAMRALLAGADGVVSVVANVAPRLFAMLCEACASGNAQGAEAIDQRLRPLYAVLGMEPNPIPVKWCLAELGVGEATLRLPLVPFSVVHHAVGQDVLNGLGLGEAARDAG